MMTWSTPPMLPTVQEAHWPWRIFSPTELSSQTSLPVFLLTATMLGALGEGTLTWLSSWPFDVLTYISSPNETGEEFARLCGNDPTSSIMSNFHTMSPS